ncbi:MAG: hypothetical protein GDA50_02250 [Alphaproteobacteria bacterium GM202ARS2]|nr:hypothetical protein [Alphaproteobacteria bacterium GM202ARS2]
MTLAALPHSSDAPLLFIQWAVGGIVYAASVMFVGVFIASHIVSHWQNQLEGHVTMQLITKQGAKQEQQKKDATEQDKQRILQLVRGTPAIAQAVWLEEEEVIRLLQPWLGSNIDIVQGISLPAVIDVTLKAQHALDPQPLRQTLSDWGYTLLIEEHNRWFSDNFAFLGRLKLFVATMMLLLTAVAALVVFFMVRVGVALHRETIDILCLVGARDAYIRKTLTRRFSFAAFRGGAFASILAALTLVGLGALHEHGLFWFQHAPTTEKQLLWGMMLIIPFIFVGVVALVTTLTTQRVLTRML